MDPADPDLDPVQPLEARQVVAKARLTGVLRADRVAEHHLTGLRVQAVGADQQVIRPRRPGAERDVDAVGALHELGDRFADLDIRPRAEDRCLEDVVEDRTRDAVHRRPARHDRREVVFPEWRAVSEEVASTHDRMAALDARLGEAERCSAPSAFGGWMIPTP